MLCCSGKIKLPSILKNLFISTTILIGVSACGGGSDGGEKNNPQPLNQPPSANAGTDQSVDEKTGVTLTGTGTDSDGTIASYSWAQTSGTIVTLQNADSSNATFEAPEVTTDEQLIFELTVTDDDGATGTDSVQITIRNVATANQPPSAHAGSAQSVDEKTNVTLTGSGTDSDGTIVSYSWAQTSGTSVTLQNSDSSTATFEAPEVTTDEQLIFELTVKDNDGAVATDSVQITILNVASPNQPPSANAGESKEALESTIVILDGSESFDSDGSINSYSWEQINNGAPELTITNERTASASIELPVLANNVEFGFRLTVTDNDGDTAQDEVIITGRPTPGVIVGDVSGNTASLNAAAEFSVKLTSAPSSNVKIPISSSDEGEGASEQSELIFTPENWQQAQTVVVRGTNENASNGEQEYQIILGATTSFDSFYDGIEPNDVNLKGIELFISQPENLNQLIADSEATLQPNVTYTGNSQLSFSLTESPAGMYIDLSTGEITWTPQVANEAQSFTVGVSVNDGNRFSTTSFQVTVAAPEPVSTEFSGNTLSVVDSSTTLNGMTITTQTTQSSASSATAASTSTADLSALNLGKLTIASVPEIPTWITPLTDVFVVRGSFKSELELRFPIANLPAGVSLSDINLYAYTEAADVVGKFWSPVSIDINFEGTIDSPVIVIELGGLEGVAFLGYATEQAQSSNGLATSSSRQQRVLRAAAATVGSVSCEQQFALGQALDKYICSSSEDEDVQVTVEGYGEGDSRWGGFFDGASKEELISWLLDAQVKFSSSSLGFDKKLTVKIHKMDYLGYVTTENYEKRKTLHISSDNSIAVSKIKGTSVHEYFHHAQGHPNTKMNQRDLLIDGGSRRDWLIEGTARWFEDELYDSLDTYKSKEGGRGYRISEVGINSASGDRKKRPYQRFSFFKLLTSSCPSFVSNFKSALNVDLASDPSGIANTLDNFENWSCNFGSHLGSGKSSSLEAALVYYNYATQYRDKLSLLDTNESGSDFKFDKPNFLFDRAWYEQVESWLTGIDEQLHQLNGVSSIPAASAYSFKVPEISGVLPEGKVAELVVESNREVIVSIISESSDFVGTNTIGTHFHSWFSTVNQTSYIYDANGTIPELFVTLVNANIDNNAKVDVYFKIRDELDVDTIITSHTTGEQVFNRVVSIAGSIPEEARDSTSKVTVTANGIASDTTLNEDGSFVADVVVTLGENVIKAQGFSGSTPVTNEEIITIQGVESSSTGRNALIASKVVFVLRWDTDSTDLDIYSTDKNGGTIWYSDKTEGPGNLDYDNTSGYGPEVVSYRATDDDIYVNGTFDIDVHYYAGSPSTNYSLDVVLNEIESGNRRSLKFDSVVPHTQSSSRQDDPGGSGVSRFNDILTVSCSSQRVCSLARVDTSKLAQAGSATPQPVSVADATNVRVMAKSSIDKPDEPDESAYKRCMRELESSVSKAGYVDWACSKDGAKLWH